MKILTVQHAIPTHCITNDWVLEQLRAFNADHFTSAQLTLLTDRVKRFLENAGTVVRYGLAAGERAIDFTLAAGRRALDDAGLRPEDVDFLIYVGVGRGWTEPAMANVVQAELKLTNATCFDVVDACASWLRGLQIAHSFLRSGTYVRGMIVNCECGFVPYRDWKLRDIDELDYRVAGWTAGEAATATVVTSDGIDDDFHFVFKNFGEHYRLCMFPLSVVADYLPGECDPRYAPMRFFALPRELFSNTIKKVVEVFSSDPVLRDGRYDIAFGHEANTKVAAMIGRQLNLPYEIYFPTHARYGNTVSSTIPLGMSVALEERKLKRGDKVLVAVGASGITVGLASFTF